MGGDDSSVVVSVWFISIITTAPYLSVASGFAFLISTHIVFSCCFATMIWSGVFAVHGVVVLVDKVPVSVTITSLVALFFFLFLFGFPVLFE